MADTKKVTKEVKKKIQEVGDLFRLPRAVKLVEDFNESNDSTLYKVTYDTKREYTFQRINRKDVDMHKVMANIDLFTDYLRSRSSASLHFRHTNNKKNYVQDEDGAIWRVRKFFDNILYTSIDDLQTIEEIGFMIGDMLRVSLGFDVNKLSVNYKELHRTRCILEHLKELDIECETKDYLIENIDKASRITDAFDRGEIKPIAAHNDPKFKHFLFSKNEKKPQVIINIDLIQPGIGLYDFASSVIHTCNDVSFDENDVYQSVDFNLSKFAAFLKGYLKVTKYLLSKTEKDLLGNSLYAIACEASALNLIKYVQGGSEVRLSKAKMYKDLAKDIQDKKPLVDNLILSTLKQIKKAYVFEINSIDRDSALAKEQTEYQAGEYMPIIIPHNISVKGGKCYAFFKRLFDIVCSLLALIVLFPFLVIIGIIVKATSKGPMIYVSKRVGKNGRIFNFYKFRSMYKDAEARLTELLAKNEVEGGITFKMKNDPRITPFGKFIRKTSLDELPQLLNILKGDMSIIGPRAGLPRDVSLSLVPIV